MKTQNNLIRLRLLAVKTLGQVYQHEQTLENAMTEVITRGKSQLPEFDRSWIFEVCSGVLRFRGRVDYIIDTYALRKKPTGIIRRFLQTAVFQLLEQDVASALVVSETVQAVRDGEGEAPSKFVNAILRKVADQREAWKQWEVTEKSPVEEQIAWCSLPDWMFYTLRRERDLAWIFAFAKACLERPKTWYRNLVTNEVMVLESYRGDEPKGYVQDISNQKLVEAVMTLISNPKLKVLDLCSAPGGKSLGLASHGFSVIATDINEERLQKVIENTSRLQFQSLIQVVPYAQVKEGKEKYDLIWIDAPCSSSGIIRRHPEVKWNREEKDLKPLQKTQIELLMWAKDHLNPSGMIIYSTCSVLQAENQPSVEGLKKIKEAEWLPQNAPFGDAIAYTVFTS